MDNNLDTSEWSNNPADYELVKVQSLKNDDYGCHYGCIFSDGSAGLDVVQSACCKGCIFITEEDKCIRPVGCIELKCSNSSKWNTYVKFIKQNTQELIW